MKHLLIVYDRKSGQIGELVEFGADEADESMRRRVKLEQEHRTATSFAIYRSWVADGAPDGPGAGPDADGDDEGGGAGALGG